VTCDQIQTKLSAYVDGELDAKPHREIEAHLKQCLACRRELEELAGIDTLLKALPRYSPPADFAKVLVSRVQVTVSPGTSRGVLHRAWQALLAHSETFFDLFVPEAGVGTQSLDEFNDIPASFIGHAYFKVLGLQR
jgi:anti-sigma factor RsiW